MGPLEVYVKKLKMQIFQNFIRVRKFLNIAKRSNFPLRFPQASDFWRLYDTVLFDGGGVLWHDLASAPEPIDGAVPLVQVQIFFQHLNDLNFGAFNRYRKFKAIERIF